MVVRLLVLCSGSNLRPLRDLPLNDMQAAETGSGKTGAFVLPAIQLVHESKRAAELAKSSSTSTPSGKRARLEDAVFSVVDRSAMVTLAPDGLAAQCRQEKEWGGVRATRGIVAGKAYYEVYMTDEGLCRVGWSISSSSLDLGTDRGGYGYGGTGKRSNDKKFEPYGEEFKNGDVIGCCLEQAEGGEEGSISWTKNGKVFGSAFRIPSRGVGALYPAVCMKNAELVVNFGSKPWRHPPPAGLVGVNQLEASKIVTSSGDSASSAGAGAGGAKGGGRGAGKEKLVPQCIILSPARDLAEQTSKAVDELKRFVVGPSVSHVLVIGGMRDTFLKDQIKAQGGSGVALGDLVIATPGKLLDLLKAGELSLTAMRLLILDEADRFTEKENMEMIRELWGKMCAATSASGAASKVQTCFFSATLHSPEIAQLSALLCTHPTWVDLKGKDTVPDTVHHVIVKVDPAADPSWRAITDAPTDGVHKGDAGAVNGQGSLHALAASEGMKRLKMRMLVSLIDSLHMDQCIIFCRTNLDCDNLEAYLTAAGGGQKWTPGKEKGKENAYSCCVLAGMRSQDERRRNLDAFREGDVRFLIATDVAARGLDIKELPYVINMTLPDEPENYIHRIGRVGRADRMGLAISFVSTTAKEKVWFHKCANRGKGCSNTKLVDQGGCTIWYDEPKLYEAIKKRIHMEDIPAMRVTLQPAGTAAGSTASPAAGRLAGPNYVFSMPEGIADGVVYGEEKHAKQGPSEHVESIRDAVSHLAKLEVMAQSTYLALKTKYAGKAL